jgi:hypothetical protein
MRILIALLMNCILLVGCTNNIMKYNVYSKDNVDNAQYNADLLECQAVSKNLTGVIEDNYTLATCMGAKGYAVTQGNRPLF